VRPCPRGRWREQYEALRSHALGEAPVAFVPLGLGILQRFGLAAWMATATTNTLPDFVGRRPSAPACPGHGGARAEQSELVEVLASLTVSIVKGECP
jgi:hypothetical protein